MDIDPSKNNFIYSHNTDISIDVSTGSILDSGIIAPQLSFFPSSSGLVKMCGAVARVL